MGIKAWGQQIKATWDDFTTEFGNSMVENGAFQGGIDNYLKNNMTQEGMLIHWGNILGSCAVGLNAGVNKGKSAYVPWQRNIYETMAFNPPAQATLNFMNDFYEATKDPNLEGIPIKSPEITVSREVEVSEYGVVMDEGYMHNYVVDNAVPKPRIWSVQGYVTSRWEVDTGFILKPSLQQQIKMLDGYAQSRRPLWFKTDENEFVRVQITSLTINRKAENMNAHALTMQLKEFVPLELFTSADNWRKASFIMSH